MFLPDPEDKLYFWSYSKAKSALGCPRRFLLGIYGVESTDPINQDTQVGSFLHKFIEELFGNRRGFGGAFNAAMIDCKFVDYMGHRSKVCPPYKELVSGAGKAADQLSKYLVRWEEKLPDIKWSYEAEFRIKKDFTEVGEKFRKAMVRSKATWFTGSVDLMGYSEAAKHLHICDFKFYKVLDPEAHMEQIRTYNTLVPAVLEERGLEVSGISNTILFLKQEEHHDLPPYDYKANKEANRVWLRAFVEKAKAKALVAKRDETELSPTNCGYCQYKRKCAPYQQQLDKDVCPHG